VRGIFHIERDQGVAPRILPQPRAVQVQVFLAARLEEMDGMIVDYFHLRRRWIGRLTNLYLRLYS
jgi:hypothetical protein